MKLPATVSAQLKILGLASITICAALFVGSCKKNNGVSRLAVYTTEDHFSRDVCEKKIGIARVSMVQIGTKTLAMLSPDYCVNRESVSPRSNEPSSFALAGPTKSKPRPRPVFIHYGYAGNSEQDKLIHEGGDQILDWAKKSGYRVLDVSGMNLTAAKKAIVKDRDSNPEDYQSGGHVTFNVDAHGATNQRGIHKIYATSENRNRTVESSLRTTDVLNGFIRSAGSKVDTIVCNVQSCEGGDTIDDPEFNRLRESKVNPKQMRVFHFGAGGGRPASTPYESSDGTQERARVEQATLLMLQNADPKKGLTVGRFREIEKKSDLREIAPEVTTFFVPSRGIPDIGSPFGTISHMEKTYFDDGPQSPTLVGPSAAFLIPPGVSPVTNYSPVLGRDGVNADIKKLPKQPSGSVFNNNNGLEPRKTIEP
jgi:hypothetical protein